jgi:hypothetical protein
MLERVNGGNHDNYREENAFPLAHLRRTVTAWFRQLRSNVAILVLNAHATMSAGVRRRNKAEA